MIIWIASYPKSGNTWVRSFLASYYFSENGIFTVEDLYKIEDYPNKQFFPGINIKKWEIYKHWEESQKRIKKNNKIKFLKTHNSLINLRGVDFTQPKYTLGIIYIIRDPRDIVISLSHFAGGSIDRSIHELLNSQYIMTTLSFISYLENISIPYFSHDSVQLITSWVPEGRK